MMAGQRGFSLVELSIVLVIIGLLIGGIMTGKAMMRTAELRGVLAEYQTYLTAVREFRQQYGDLPGDTPNATQYWGLQSMSACTNNASAGSTLSDGVCDGDANGSISSMGSTANDASEIYQFWRHLARAGLLQGTYSGVAGPSNGLDAIHGENTPQSKMKGGGWITNHYSTGGNSSLYNVQYGNVLAFGVRVSDTVLMRGGIMTPKEMRDIDSKIDDGQPAKGNIIALNWGNAVSDNRCTVNSANMNDFDADYNMTYSGLICAFIARNQF